MSASINSLSDETMAHVLGFVGDAPSLVKSLGVCSAFRNVLTNNDNVWASCPGALDRPEGVVTNRESSCIHFVTEKIRAAQKDPENTIVKVLGPQGVITFFQSFLLDEDGPLKYYLRGDTLGLLVEILQDFFYVELSKAHEIAIHSHRRVPTLLSRGYPTLTKEDLQLLDGFRGNFGGHYSSAGSLFLQYGERRLTYHNRPGAYSFSLVKNFTEEEIDALVPKDQQVRLIRNLAFRAGVVKLTSESFAYIWKSFVRMTQAVLHETMERASPNTLYEPSGVMDFCHIALDTNVSPATFQLVIVPAILREGAASLGMSKCYGSGELWIARSGKTRDQEVKAGLGQYVDPTFVDAIKDQEVDEEMEEEEEEDEWDPDMEEDDDDDDDYSVCDEDNDDLP